VDSIFRHEEQYDHDAILKDFIRGGKIRFRTKHLLIATAGLALFLAAGKLTNYWLVLLVCIIGGVLAALGYLSRREQQHDAELDRKKRAFRASVQGKTIPAATTDDAAPGDAAPGDAEVDWHDTAGKFDGFRFSFSMRQLMIAITIAAVVMGVASLIGPGTLAIMLGILALVGLVSHAVGYEPAPVVTLVWWLMLVLYIGFTVLAMFLASLQSTACIDVLITPLV
jgi:hypothetical protein